MNHSPNKIHQYYCLTAPQELIKGFNIPLQADMKKPQHVAEFSKLVDMELLSMRKVRQGQRDRDWERVCHLSVSVPQVGHWLFPEESGEVSTGHFERGAFIDLVEEYACPELADYFNDYFHQQGFDALPRTIVSSLLQQQYNQNNSNSIKSLKEVAHGHAVGTYFKILSPGCIEYEMYNAYSHQRVDYQDERALVKDKELPLFVRLTGQISYDQQTGVITHEIKELSFIVNQQYQDDLKIFLNPASHTNKRSDFLNLFVPASKNELPRFLVEAQLSENQNLIDFTQRFLAGAIKARRSGSPQSVQDIDNISIDIQRISDTVILKPVTAHMNRSKNIPATRKNGQL